MSLLLALTSGGANAVGDGSLAGIALTSITGSASGDAVGDGSLAGITLTAITGSASGGSIVNASGDGSLAPISLTALTGIAIGSAVAGGTLSSIALSAIQGSASGGASLDGVGNGPLPSISLIAITGGALGNGAVELVPEITYPGLQTKKKSKAGKGIGGARWQRYEIEDLKDLVITKPSSVDVVVHEKKTPDYTSYIELINGTRQATSAEQSLQLKIRAEIEALDKQIEEDDMQIACAIAAML